ncbi:50S ribosomal protein L10 [Candidatus Woesearchaeota archaeon]|nr:50S ribosomal protein L10 [Candidatus Woesearchaeota archaeon]
MNPKAHVSEAKKKVVANLVKLIKENPIIGVVNMENLPASQLQKISAKLRENVVLTMTKKRLMKLAFEKTQEDKKGVIKLIEHLKGMPALLFTKQDPFELFKTLKKNKSFAPAKAGQIAPCDLSLKAGPTPFAPGPIIGELGAMGLKTKVEDNKINIIENKVVVKEGEEVKANVAGILSRLGVKPVEIGLELVAVYENGDILTKDILDIDEEAYINDMKSAHSEAFTLAVELSYPIEEVIAIVLPKIHGEARTLALEQEILTDETSEDILKKAENGAMKLKGKVPEDAPAPQDSPKQEETPAEEKQEEKVAESEDNVKNDESKADKEISKEETPKAEEKKEEVNEEEEKKEESPKEEPETENKPEKVEGESADDSKPEEKPSEEDSVEQSKKEE